MKTAGTFVGLALGVALAGTSIASSAQRGRPPVERVERATQAGNRAQERAAQAARAQERAAQATARAQDRAARGQERAARIPDQVNRAARVPDRADRAERAQRGRRDGPEQAARVQTNPDKARSEAGPRGEALVRAYPEYLELSQSGPTVRGQLVALDPTAAELATLRRAGFGIGGEQRIEGIELRTVTLRVPTGRSVDQALADAARLIPGVELAPNSLHFQSGVAAGAAAPEADLANGRVSSDAIGLIDAGVARHPAIKSPVEQRSFGRGGATPNHHATAIASLLVGSGRVKGVARGAGLLVADIYGRGPPGGNALAIAQALGWLVSRNVKVVALPVEGPRNALVERAVVAAQQRGAWIVAPVGNQGPAAPPSFPASYPQVIAVTGVDGRRRALIEAGRSPKLDYAAPGADIVGAAADGGIRTLRGTSFAVPFVAGRLFEARRRAAEPLVALNREAADLGAPGYDPIFGRGLVCGGCGTHR
jgi:hypothetical protein